MPSSRRSSRRRSRRSRRSSRISSRRSPNLSPYVDKSVCEDLITELKRDTDDISTQYGIENKLPVFIGLYNKIFYCVKNTNYESVKRLRKNKALLNKLLDNLDTNNGHIHNASYNSIRHWQKWYPKSRQKILKLINQLEIIQYKPYRDIRNPPNDICVICYEVLNTAKTVKMKNCSHVFHKNCINEWIINRGKHTCPMCRTDINID
jgi:hypothetical protein